MEYFVFNVEHHKWTVNATQNFFFSPSNWFETRATLEAETQKPTVLMDLFFSHHAFCAWIIIQRIAVLADVFFCASCRTKKSTLSWNICLRSFNLIILKWLIKNKFKSIFIKYFFFVFITLYNYERSPFFLTYFCYKPLFVLFRYSAIPLLFAEWN